MMIPMLEALIHRIGVTPTLFQLCTQMGSDSRYDHLEYGSAKVRVGQQVRAGQEIAKVGMTGYTYIPHLHFHVFVFTGYNIWTDFDTLEVKYFV